MKKYYYDWDTQYLCVNEDYTQPFLCPAEAVPLKFQTPKDCLEFLTDQNFEGSVMYKVRPNVLLV